MPTVRELCDLLGTTRVTLKEALNQLETEHILYRKERLGIFVSPKIYHKIIYILFNSSHFTAPASSPFWSMLWLGLEQEAQRRAAFKDEVCIFRFVKVLDNSSGFIPEEAKLQLQGQRVDGMIVIGMSTKARKPEDMPTVPCVTYAGGGDWLVSHDGREFGRMAVSTLVRQHCQRIGLWLRDVHVLDEVPEYQGLKQALTENKVSLYPDLIRLPYLPAQNTLSLQEQGYLLAKEVFSPFNSTKPDGVIIADDMMTDGALVAFEELGIRVGKDLKVVTHANVNSPILFGRTKNLTVIEYNVAHLIQAMFSMLDILMTGQTPAEHTIYIKPAVRL